MIHHLVSRLLRSPAFSSGGRPFLIPAINVAEATPARTISAINVTHDAKTGWSVIKFGVYPNRVGLQVFDQEAAQAMLSAFNSRESKFATAFRGEPIYIGHPDDAEWAKANPGVRAEAVGRIREMKVEADGLHLRTTYNDQGKRLVEGEAPAYEAFSPNWGMLPITYQGRKAFRPVELYSIGLTNQPNIPGSFIGLNEALPPENQNQNPAMKLKIIALLAALGRPALAADVSDAALETAINESLPVATKFVEDAGKLVTATNETGTVKAQVTTLQGQLTAASNEAATLRTAFTAERTARAEAVLVTAVNEGRITAAQKPEWLAKFTAAGADFSAVQGELSKLQKAVNTQSRSAIGARRGQPVDKTKITAINEAIVAKMKALNTEDRNLAYLTLQREGHELFKNDVATVQGA